MADYESWIRRAVQYVHTLPRLPGRLVVSGSVRAAIDDSKFDELSAGCRLAIPDSLRRLWTQGTSGSDIKYHWSEIPRPFQRQVCMASDDRFRDYLWGGPEILPAEEIVELSHHFPSWAEGMRPDYPKDARIWDYSLPLVPVGNGDYVGLYLADNQRDPPVVYLCHEGCGGSTVIADTLAEFLEAWEELCFVGVDFLITYCSPDTGRLALRERRVQVEALRSLLQGQVRDDLVPPRLVQSEADWLNSRDPDRMLQWLEQQGMRVERKLRLYCCACCLRVQTQIGESGRRALETSMRYADGDASSDELSSARDGFVRGVSLAPDDNFLENLTSRIACSREEGLMQRLRYSVIDACWYISGEITCHFDEPQASEEKAHHADLVRHIFGNPFRAAEPQRAYNLAIIRLAKRLYEGEDVAAELCHELRATGSDELANHFQQPGHPRGCWALDSLLGR